MVNRFDIVGVIHSIPEYIKDSRFSQVKVKVDNDLIVLHLQGKLIQLLSEDKLRVGDSVYSSGRLSVSNTVEINGCSIVSYIVSYLSVISL